MSDENNGTALGSEADPAASTVEPGTTPNAVPNATTEPEGGAAGDTSKGEGAEGAEGTGSKEDGDKGDKADGPPETYEFTVPEGAELADEDREAFVGLCKELKLSQETAQALLEKQFANREAAQQAAIEEMGRVQASWREAQAADKEFGGTELPANLALANKAIEKFAGDRAKELRTLLNDSRLGDHPEMIRFMYRVGKAIAEDSFTPPAGESTGQKTPGQRLYPTLPA